MPTAPSWLRPAMFGLCDGMMSLLGVVLYLLHHPTLIFPAAVAGAVSNSLSMAGGEFLSESDNGFGASAVMGVATGAGALIPAIPFAFTSGPLALFLMVIGCIAVAIAVGLMRVRKQRRKVTVMSLVPTLVLLGLIFGAVLTVTLVLPSPPA